MKIIEDAIKDNYEIHISKLELIEALALLGKKDMEAKLYHPVKHGRWVIDPNSTMRCGVCGWVFEYYAGLEEEWNNCPHCGARMDLIGEDKSHPFAESVMMGMDGGENE